jgi:amidase
VILVAAADGRNTRAILVDPRQRPVDHGASETQWEMPMKAVARACMGIGIAMTTLAVAAQPALPAAPARQPFAVVEASIADMRRGMDEGRTTSREIVAQHLLRIALHEERVNAAITVNPAALREAEERDRERAQGKVRGPLHGIPIALKDNIHTLDMPTTGGVLAFRDLRPPYEATLTRLLRDAGAVILAKTVMTELGHWVGDEPGNYNAVSGHAMNPYDPRRDPRPATFDGRPALSTGGSSSGAGTATSFWVANVGTETSGSILFPANLTMLAAIKPTVGRISRHGIIPLTADQDTAGPMARSVADAAILLGVLEGPAPDPNDEAATRTCTPPPNRDYTAFLRADALKGARIGIPRAYFYNRAGIPGSNEPRGGLNPERARIMAEAIAALQEQGAVIVDPANLPSVLAPDRERNVLAWEICEKAKGSDADCSTVLKYGFKRDFNRWLASLGAAAPVKTLTELREWNRTHERAGAIRYGQGLLDISDELHVEQDRARYEADRARGLRLAGEQGIDAAFVEHRLDALLFPGSSGADVAAIPGYPTVIVPFGLVPNAPRVAFPPDFDAKPAPFGVSFTARACSEPRLIALAYAFEQATKRRVPPPDLP